MPNSVTKNRFRHLVPTALSEVDNLFEHVFGAAPAPLSWRASASLWEEEDRVHLEIDAPGVAREGVDVTFDKGTLTVQLERLAVDGRQYHHNERGFGQLTRTLALPDTVDPDSIEASLADGVLHVSIAKKPEAQPKKIELR